MVCFMTISLVIQQNKPKLVKITFILVVIFIYNVKSINLHSLHIIKHLSYLCANSMGRKFGLSRRVKNWEKKSQASMKRSVGRPRKKVVESVQKNEQVSIIFVQHNKN